jgi:hypothetical protein
MSLSGRPASVPEELIAMGSMLPFVRPDDKAIPDHFCRFPIADIVRGQLVDIVLHVPVAGIESVPVNHS